MDFPFNDDVEFEGLEAQLDLEGGSVRHDDLLFVDHLTLLGDVIELAARRKRQLPHQVERLVRSVRHAVSYLWTLLHHRFLVWLVRFSR